MNQFAVSSAYSGGAAKAVANVAEPVATDKRAALQTMLLKKSLDLQQSEADQASNQLQGKGQIIDLRV